MEVSDMDRVIALDALLHVSNMLGLIELMTKYHALDTAIPILLRPRPAGAR